MYKKLQLSLLLFSMVCYMNAQSSSCGSGGNVSGSIANIGYNGSNYWLGVPNNINGPLPLVIALHGDEGHPNNMKSFWENLWASRKDFIFMAPKCPDSICRRSGINTWSRGGHSGSEPQALWLKDAIRHVADNYPVDVSRIYAVGYSGGAIFLGYQGFKMFQDVFAGIQWFCGGVNETEQQVYQAPDNPNCKVPGRCVISRSGDRNFLVTAADRIIEILSNNGHINEFLDTGCNGHCCNAGNYSSNALNWFLSLPPKCGELLGGGCYEIDDTTSSTLSVENNTIKEDYFNIYPNPSKGSFTISSPTYENQPINLTIYDFTGKVVFKKVNYFLKTGISMDKVSTGIYLVEMNDGDNLKLRKKIVIH